METLEELKNKYKKLQEESNNLHSKIKALENQDTLKEFTVGNCYLDIWNDRFAKVIAVDTGELCAIIINECSIKRDWFTVEDIKIWKKITSEQFKDIYLAVLKDIQDPDLDDNKKSNWDVVSESIMNSINKGE